MPDSHAQQSTFIHQDPVALANLFSSTRLAIFWVFARLYVGWVWVAAGWAMIQEPGWMSNGTAMHQALSDRSGGPGGEITGQLVSLGVIDWIARATAVGLTIAGIAVLLGLATGFAAFAGVVFSVNLLLSDATLIGPEVFAVAMLLVLAWKTAGWIGLDRWVLPVLGAPWPGGFEMRRRSQEYEWDIEMDQTQ
jgi:thiosulfate dehydrogenase (quinone) large subunit